MRKKGYTLAKKNCITVVKKYLYALPGEPICFEVDDNITGMGPSIIDSSLNFNGNLNPDVIRCVRYRMSVVF